MNQTLINIIFIVFVMYYFCKNSNKEDFTNTRIELINNKIGNLKTQQDTKINDLKTQLENTYKSLVYPHYNGARANVESHPYRGLRADEWAYSGREVFNNIASVKTKSKRNPVEYAY